MAQPFACQDNFLLPLLLTTNSTPPFTLIHCHLTCNNFVQFLLASNLQHHMCHPICPPAPMSLSVMMLCASLWIRPTMVHTAFCVGRLSILFWTSRDTRKLLPSIVSSPHFLNPTYFQLPSSHLRNRHLPHNKMHNLRVPLAQEDESIFQTVMELFNFCQIELNIHYFFLLFFSLLYLALFSVYRMPFHVHSRGGSLVATPFWFLYFHFISYVCLLFSIHRHCHCLHTHTFLTSH